MYKSISHNNYILQSNGSFELNVAADTMGKYGRAEGKNTFGSIDQQDQARRKHHSMHLPTEREGQIAYEKHSTSSSRLERQYNAASITHDRVINTNISTQAWQTKYA